MKHAADMHTHTRVYKITLDGQKKPYKINDTEQMRGLLGGEKIIKSVPRKRMPMIIKEFQKPEAPHND